MRQPWDFIRAEIVGAPTRKRASIARCRRLAKDYPHDTVAKYFRELTQQLERELRTLELRDSGGKWEQSAAQ